MENWKWLYPGIGLKRWFFLMTISFILISTGIFFLMNFQVLSYLETAFIAFFHPLLGERPYLIKYLISFILIITGLWGINFSYKGISRALNDKNSHQGFVDRLYKERVLERGPKIVAIGGGTGLSNLLRGLKKYTSNITAIVTVADDGGSSGKLRDELDILPPGDIRNCLVALADAEPLMQDLFQYRFSSNGHLEGHSFGNLFIASLTEVMGDFEEAVRESSKVLAIRGQVLPATNEDIRLGAVYLDESVKMGESVIPEVDKKIKRVFLEPSNAESTPAVVKAINEADIIVVGPGSLYTSIIPNLLINDIVDAVDKSSAAKFYICNVMTQPGETTGYTAGDHLEAIINHTGGKQLFDYILLNSESGSGELAERYKDEGAYPVKIDREKINDKNVKIIENKLLQKNNYLRHNPDKLARVLLEIAESG